MDPPLMSHAHNQPDGKRCPESDEAHCGQSEANDGILNGDANVYSTVDASMPEPRPKIESCYEVESNILYSETWSPRGAIISTLASINAPVEVLSQEEQGVVRETCAVPEPFEKVTVEVVSADRYSG